VILTYDADFGALLRLRRRHPGVVIVRLRHLQAQRVIAALDYFLKKHAAKDLRNLVVVVEESRIRFRNIVKMDASKKSN
jgi:predicted nuclease of predicted toxin-antitoxin system